MRCYNGASGDCTTAPVSFPISQIATTATVDGLSSKTVEYLNGANLPTELDEFDYGASNPTRKTITMYASLGNNIQDRPSSVTIQDGNGNQIGRTTYGYDEFPLASSGLPSHPITGSRGNLTSTHRWVNTTNTTIDTYNTYDDAGQLMSTKDGRGNPTLFSYDPATDSCLNSTTLPTPSSGVSIVSLQSCDTHTGLVSTTTDPNDVTTAYSYDSVLRSTGTTVTGVNGLAAKTTTIFSGGSLPETITTTVTATPSPDQISTTVLDPYGRVATTTAPNGALVVTTYNSMGRVNSVTNPYFSPSDSTYGVTSYAYDGLGRKVLQCQPDNGTTGSCVPGNNYLQWSYSANATTSYDERRNAWTSAADAFGRLIQVIEPGSLKTGYSYDTLNNLKCVDQWGTTMVGAACSSSKLRTFTYDSLSRLLSSTNPETGTICYGLWSGSNCANGYDANGNLQYKTDARGVAVNYTYDALNRLIAKRSAGGSGVAGFNYAYGYDKISPTTEPNLIGRLAWTSNNVNATEIYSYDSMGRVTGHSVGLPSNYMPPWTKSVVSTGYDLAGNATDLTYPDGHHLKQTWDGAGRLSSSALVDIGGVPQSQSYLTSATYNPDGSPNALTLGNGVQETTAENNRLEVQSLTVNAPGGPLNSAALLSHTYCYTGCTTGGTANNGNIWGITDSLRAANNQGFTYDSLNRIGSFSLGGVLNRQYAIDSFGNLSGVVGGTAVTNFDSATNRISNLPCAAALPPPLLPYDAAGNQLCSTDANGAVSQYSYNADGQIGQIALLGYAGSPYVTYTYDPNGNRILKSNASGTFTEYVYSGGQPLAELNSDGTWSDYIYANGQKIAKVASSDTRIHTSGVFTTNGNELRWNLPTPTNADGSPYTAQAGDMLCFRQYQGPGAVGGPAIYFSNGLNSAWIWQDTSGNTMNQLFHQGAWYQRCADMTLGGRTTGTQIGWLALVTDVATGPGTWDIWYADMSITRADGSVIPIITAQPPTPVYGDFQGGGWIGTPQAVVETVPAASDPTGGSASVTAHYYLDDHLGTAQMELSAGGWPLWQGQFAPFGQELDTQTTSMHYKFTGKERDAESGLDYFGARYMSSSMGRFMSPDWSATADPVPYARMDDPQSLNLYAYVGNNPLSRRDGDGHHQECQHTSSSSTDSDGNIHVTVREHCTEVPDFMFAGLLLGGFGHHYIPQSISNGFNSMTQRFSNSITSGPLVDKTKNYYDALHRAYNDRVRAIIQQYLRDTGKNMKQLSTSDIKAIVQKMKAAGGEIEEFNNRLNADESPTLRNMDEALRDGIKTLGENAGQAIEETIEECEAGAPCIPPL
ncbi:MAG TPA: RHS repeat-associated core domain-containing protein [Acidobacteriaceae bacterium]|nr:RHS repeat-associated core domain-containing protein [Acidobacteriaceae bacterium]